jgi:hypothetical protein
LLSWPASVVVHDIKGENWGLTAGWRQRDLGSVCLKFDPTATDGSSARSRSWAGVFFCWLRVTPLRSTVLIDGQNLYHGSVSMGTGPPESGLALRMAEL